MAKLKFSKTDDGVSRLPFKPLAKYEYLCIGTPISVAVTKKESDEEKEWEFAGHIVPRFAIDFVQHREREEDPDRYYTHSEIPQTVVRKDGSEMEESTVLMRYQMVWHKIKHIYDSFDWAPNWKPFPFDPDFTPDADVDTRIKEWTKFFDKVEGAFNKGKDGENPIFPTERTKDNLMVLKLVANGNRLGFPDFAGTGFIEKAKIAKSGKLDTTLEFKYNETFEIARSTKESAMPAVEAGSFGAGNVASAMPGKLSDALG